MMEQIYLSLGSNLGHREEYIREAIGLIHKRVGTLEQISRLYASEAWGFSSAYQFYNCCVSLRGSMDALVLMEALLEIERELGRQRKGRGYRDRVIDIDLLIYGERQVDLPELKLPHPSMGDRKFVLLPLAEIAPDLVHPVAGIRIDQMLQQCPDRSEVVPLPYTGHQDRFNSSTSQNI